MRSKGYPWRSRVGASNFDAPDVGDVREESSALWGASFLDGVALFLRKLFVDLKSSVFELKRAHSRSRERGQVQIHEHAWSTAPTGLSLLFVAEHAPR